MIVKLGFIGPIHSINKAKEIVQNISNLRLHTYIYKTPSEVPKLYKNALEENDAVCFSGIIPYYYRDWSLKVNKPIIIIPFNEYMIVTSLLASLLNDDVSIKEISLDLPNKNILNQIEKDLSFKLNKKYIYDYNWIYNRRKTKELNFEEIITFHEQLYNENKTKIAITSIHYVYDQLNKRNIPAKYMTDYNQNMINSLQKAKNSVIHSQLKGGMIAVIYLSLKSLQPFLESETKKVTSKIHLFNAVLNIELASEDKRTLIFYTTRTMIEDNLLSLHNKNWITELEAELKKPFYFGIGYGRHLLEAEENAENAIQTAQTYEGSNGCIVTETKRSIGPILGNTTTDKTRSSDDWLNELIILTKTNMKTMQRFINFMKLNQYQPFTIKELSTYSNVTVRTSERFIKRLYNNKIITQHGQEQNYHQGRPRTVYILANNIENKFRNYAN